MDQTSDQIGERLRKARGDAGLTVDDVALKTRIPRSAVEALEAENFSFFAGPTYARSFLSQYCEFLNVDAREWLDALEPASFLPCDVLQPSSRKTEAAHHHRPVKRPESVPSGRGWKATVGTLAISTVVVYVAIQGYQFLENRLGGDSGPLMKRDDAHAAVAPVPAGTKPEGSPAVVPPENSPPAASPEKAAATASAEESAEPVPRATVVRDLP